MQTEIIFDATKTVMLVLKKIKTILFVLFGKIGNSLQRILHFHAEYEH